MTNTIKEIKVWVGDLAEYNAGKLIGDWFELPMDTEEILNQVLVAGNEEYFIADIEAPFNTDSYSLNELNEIAENMLSFDDEETEVLSILLDSGMVDSVDEGIEKVSNREYSIYSDCRDMGDVAYEITEMTGMLSNVPSEIEMYFDYDKYGRDLEINGYFYQVNHDTFIELHM